MLWHMSVLHSISGWVVFHCPFTHRWICGLLSTFGYCEECSCEHLCTSFGFKSKILFQLFWVHSLGYMVTLCLAFWGWTFLFWIIFFFFFGCTGSSLLCRLFSSCSKQGLLSSCGAQASHYSGFSCCRARALGHTGFSACGMWTQ